VPLLVISGAQLYFLYIYISWCISDAGLLSPFLLGDVVGREAEDLLPGRHHEGGGQRHAVHRPDQRERHRRHRRGRVDHQRRGAERRGGVHLSHQRAHGGDRGGTHQAQSVR